MIPMPRSFDEILAVVYFHSLPVTCPIVGNVSAGVTGAFFSSAHFLEKYNAISGERNDIDAPASNALMCGVAKMFATYQMKVAIKAKSIIVNDTLGFPLLSLRNGIMFVTTFRNK
jgi:hypothetical protein